MKAHVLLKSFMAAIMLAAVPVTALAIVSPTPTPTSQASKITLLKTKGATEIDRRIANLNSALTKLAASTTLKASDKAALTSQIQAELTGLNALKAKLAADTDLATVRTDIQSIFSDYRVYYLMLPKTRMIASADRFDVAEAKLTALQAALQTKVTAIKASGTDVAAMQKSLDDMKAKIADAQTKSTSVVTPLLALQPSDYNSNHTVLLQYRQTMQAAQVDVKTARDDGKSVIDALKTTGASPSASPAK